jgi:hypothetical protein
MDFRCTGQTGDLSIKGQSPLGSRTYVEEWAGPQKIQLHKPFIFIYLQLIQHLSPVVTCGSLGSGDKIGETMKYLCCVYLKPNALQGLSADELAKLNRDSLGYNDELAKKGHYIAAAALQPPQTAKTIRRQDGKTLVTDGPYAETKEVLGGFILIEARDMEEAIRIAENIPVGEFASIEVRPDMKID